MSFLEATISHFYHETLHLFKLLIPFKINLSSTFFLVMVSKTTSIYNAKNCINFDFEIEIVE